MDESTNQSSASGAEATSPSNVRSVAVEVYRRLTDIFSRAAIVEVNDDPSQKEDSYKCPVCLDTVRMRKPVSTICGHVFCKDCLIAAIDSFNKCPLCNKKLEHSQFSRIYL